MSAELLELEMAGAVPVGSRPRPLLLLGPPGSGRSTLLFRAALAGASIVSSPRVLFLAPRALERLPGGKAAGGGAIQKIHFLYPSSFQELVQLVASLHQTLPNSPSMIVLDGLEEYLNSCSSACTAAKLVALLLDTSSHFTQKRSHLSVGCQLIVSMRFLGEAGEEVENFSAIERYFPAKLWLHPDTGKDVGLHNQGLTKLIRAQLFQPGTKDQEWIVKFDTQGSMTISPLPCKNETENETVSENRLSVSEVDTILSNSRS
ncbi:ATPase SWSAP1 [Protobothrops mucrosquamatus]|uniref:ATPase SWSAP1 n=1 Tax=Protobothrops mucrosquamatus TaxID=103944 RepID=UPI000775E9DE|nr:ATPase SWSAP1 [Protobothrops mucrosquamatus]